MKKVKLKRRIVELFARNNNLETEVVILRENLTSLLSENSELISKVVSQQNTIKDFNQKMIRKEQMLTTKSTLIQMKQLRIELLNKKLTEK